MMVETRIEDELAILTLNDAARRNALSAELVAALCEALDSVAVQAARAVIVAGNGPAFCAGADIQGLLDNGWMEADGGTHNPVEAFAKLAAHPRPVIAAVHGMALGGGFELSLSCDLVVASADARFALPEAGLGVIPNTALAVLGSMIGPRRAYALAATGKRLSAAEALDLGLVNEVVESDATQSAAPLERAKALALDMTGRMAPGALAGIKRALARHEAIDWTLVQSSLAALPREEWQEGLGAFAARRKPDYARFWRDDKNRKT